jgi:hypothetical protein
MIAKAVVETEWFISMPASAKCLYFYANLKADDDGVVDCMSVCCMMAGASEDDVRILEDKNYIIKARDGLWVLKHFGQNNEIKKDRYKPTVYQDAIEGLTKKKDGSYTRCIQNVSNMEPPCLQNGSLDKNSIVESREGKYRLEQYSKEDTNNTSLTDYLNKNNKALTREEPSEHLKRLLANGFAIPKDKQAEAENALDALVSEYGYAPTMVGINNFLMNSPEYGKDVNGDEVDKPIGYMRNAIENEIPNRYKEMSKHE